MSMPASSWSFSARIVASRLASASAAPSCRHGAQSLRGSASHDGLGRLPAMVASSMAALLFVPRIDHGNPATVEIADIAGHDAGIVCESHRGDYQIRGLRVSTGALATGENFGVGLRCRRGERPQIL